MVKWLFLLEKSGHSIIIAPQIALNFVKANFVDIFGGKQVMKLLLFVTGRTVWNLEGRFQVQAILHFFPESIDTLKKNSVQYLKDISFDKIYSVIYQEAVKSAEIIKANW